MAGEISKVVIITLFFSFGLGHSIGEYGTQSGTDPLSYIPYVAPVAGAAGEYGTNYHTDSTSSYLPASSEASAVGGYGTSYLTDPTNTSLPAVSSTSAGEYGANTATGSSYLLPPPPLPEPPSPPDETGWTVDPDLSVTTGSVIFPHVGVGTDDNVSVNTGSITWPSIGIGTNAHVGHVGYWTSTSYTAHSELYVPLRSVENANYYLSVYRQLKDATRHTVCNVDVDSAQVQFVGHVQNPGETEEDPGSSRYFYCNVETSYTGSEYSTDFNYVENDGESYLQCFGSTETRTFADFVGGVRAANPNSILILDHSPSLTNLLTTGLIGLPQGGQFAWGGTCNFDHEDNRIDFLFNGGVQGLNIGPFENIQSMVTANPSQIGYSGSCEAGNCTLQTDVGYQNNGNWWLNYQMASNRSFALGYRCLSLDDTISQGLTVLMPGHSELTVLLNNQSNSFWEGLQLGFSMQFSDRCQGLILYNMAPPQPSLFNHNWGETGANPTEGDGTLWFFLNIGLPYGRR